jgi:hypothetical protein
LSTLLLFSSHLFRLFSPPVFFYFFRWSAELAESRNREDETNRLLQLALLDAQQEKLNLSLLQEKLEKVKLDFLHLNNENTELINNSVTLSAKIKEGEGTAIRLAREAKDREVDISAEGDILRKEIKRLVTENAVLVDNLEYLSGIKEENSRNEDRIEVLKDDIKDLTVSGICAFCYIFFLFSSNTVHYHIMYIVHIID